jgi:hypothetical protein
VHLRAPERSGLFGAMSTGAQTTCARWPPRRVTRPALRNRDAAHLAARARCPPPHRARTHHAP